MKLKITISLLLGLSFVPMLHGCGKAPASADNPPTLSPAEKANFDAAAAKAAQQAPPANAPPANVPPANVPPAQ